MLCVKINNSDDEYPTHKEIIDICEKRVKNFRNISFTALAAFTLDREKSETIALMNKNILLGSVLLVKKDKYNEWKSLETSTENPFDYCNIKEKDSPISVKLDL